MRVSTLALPALLGAAMAKKCINQTVEVDISSRNAVFGKIVVPQSNIDVTNFTLRFTKQGHNFSNEGLTGYETVSGTYKISTQYCTPDQPSPKNKNPVIQVLTHGIGFDKTYWDLSFNNFQQSYVNNAVDKHGYHTLSYDRLGIGKSYNAETSEETLNEIQSFLEIQALRALTEKLRAGTFPQVKTKYSTVVHVGHSFGSAQTYAFANAYPQLTNGIVLTGFSMNASFVADFVLGGNFVQAKTASPRFASLPLGYITDSDEEGLLTQFLLPGYYPPPLLAIGFETGQPVTTGELLSLGSLTATNAFSGPVLVFTGDSDVPYCGGDCLITGVPTEPSIPANVAKNFPSAKNFEAYIQPNTGHGITFHYNATAGYEVVASYLAVNGLSADGQKGAQGAQGPFGGHGGFVPGGKGAWYGGKGFGTHWNA